MPVALELNHVWKKFHRGEFNDCLRDAIPAFFKSIAGFGPSRSELSAKDFWALSDIDFKVEEGERLGIIGHNGAGKSTLLKVLSQIIAPNRGSMKVHGRLRALIEVGAGFHGDLTGRENIYLNGAILGMTRQEIDRNFDSIVDFSGVEAFLDTPVKRYSSGMAARLGFAVAAHLDPDILIVDEVLSVGDSQFQKKCLGKMKDVANTGRTVLFVSHNMAAVRQLCSRAILLKKGELIDDGTPDDVIGRYLNNFKAQEGVQIAERTNRLGTGQGRVLNLGAGTSPDTLGEKSFCDYGGPLFVRIGYRIDPDQKDPVIMLGIANSSENTICQFSTQVSNQGYDPQTGEGVVEFHIPHLYLVPGNYSLYVVIGNKSGRIFDDIKDLAELYVGNSENSGVDFSRGYCYGTLFPFEWRQA
ncbi:MAG: ABC transporter ATP-binding protein [Thermoguttaceae bacterium]|nr:ABC transporter ATP-binding protein [Thermoguttaceae bacterium]